MNKKVILSIIIFAIFIIPISFSSAQTSTTTIISANCLAQIINSYSVPVTHNASSTTVSQINTVPNGIRTSATTFLCSNGSFTAGPESADIKCNSGYISIGIQCVAQTIPLPFSIPTLSPSPSPTATPTPLIDTTILIKQLQALIISLQTQINELKVKLAATQKDVEIVKSEIQFTKSLARGTEGDEVKQLQEVLSKDPEIYPEGKVTGFFGPATEAAVKRFQEKHGIESLGTIGPKTRAKLNELITQGAGKSGMVPQGLEKRLGTTTFEQIPRPTTPSGTIPAQPVGQTGTTTIPAISAFFATTTGVTPTSTIPAIPAQPVGQTGVTTIAATPAVSTNSSPTPSPSPSASPTATTTDTIAPSSPTGLIATPVYNWHITLTWSKSTDNVGVVGYKVYRNGTQLFSAATSSSLSTLTYRDWNVSVGTNYSYTVAAYDGAGNVSTQSTAVSVTPSGTTASPSPSLSPSSSPTLDTTPPIISNVQAVNITATSSVITWITDEASDSQVEYGLGTNYGSQTALDANRTTSHSTNLSGLTGSTVYHYRVKSKDVAGNLTTSGDYTFTTVIAQSSLIAPTSVNGGFSNGPGLIQDWGKIHQSVDFTYTLTPDTSAVRLYEKKPGENIFSVVVEFSNVANLSSSGCTKYASSGSYVLTLSCNYTNKWSIYRVSSPGTFTPDNQSISTFTPGDYYFYVAAVDSSGKEGPSSLTGSRTLAVFTIDSPTASQSPTVSNPTFRWSAPSSNGFTMGYTIRIAPSGSTGYLSSWQTDISVSGGTVVSKVYDGSALDPTKQYVVNIQGSVGTQTGSQLGGQDSFAASPSTFWISSASTTSSINSNTISRLAQILESLGNILNSLKLLQ